MSAGATVASRWWLLQEESGRNKDVGRRGLTELDTAGVEVHEEHCVLLQDPLQQCRGEEAICVRPMLQVRAQQDSEDDWLIGLHEYMIKKYG